MRTEIATMGVGLATLFLDYHRAHRARQEAARLPSRVQGWAYFRRGRGRCRISPGLLVQARSGQAMTPSAASRRLLRCDPCAYVAGLGQLARYTIDPKDPGFVVIDWSTAQPLRRYSGRAIIRAALSWVLRVDSLEARVERLHLLRAAARSCATGPIRVKGARALGEKVGAAILAGGTSCA